MAQSNYSLNESREIKWVTHEKHHGKLLQARVIQIPRVVALVALRLMPAVTTSHHRSYAKTHMMNICILLRLALVVNKRGTGRVSAFLRLLSHLKVERNFHKE